MSDVYVYVYDLSKGLARQLSAAFLGKHFDGIWHTGIVAFGQEWFYGSGGIDSCPPKGTMLGDPDEMIHLGRTEMSEADFFEILRQMSESSFKIGTYNIIEHNCNNFSDELAQIITGRSIPAHILDLPKEILSTPMGAMLRPMLEQAADPIQHTFGTRPDFLHRGGTPPTTSFAAAATASSPSTSTDEKLHNNATVFKPDVKSDIDVLLNNEQIKSMVSADESQLLNDLKASLTTDERKSLTSHHIKLLFDLFRSNLSHREQKLIILKMLQQLALKKNVAKLIESSKYLYNEILPKAKHYEIILQNNILQMLSNICTHSEVNTELFRHQDQLFSTLSDFVLVNEQTSAESLALHESAVSFFFNWICAYHQEKLLNDANSLALGCALMETLRMNKSSASTSIQMLSLLKGCLSQSSHMREYAESMDLNLDTYRSNKDCASLIKEIESILKSSK